MDYLHKITDNPYGDLLWNIPEQASGSINIIGGNASSFRTPVKVAEFLAKSYPLKSVQLVLPDALSAKVPPLDNFIFLSSTESGSFRDGAELAGAIFAADASILIGDLSKNSVTKKAVASACDSSEKPLYITRDATDLVAESATDALLMNENLVFFASIPQLQKLFRAVYYPKMILMSSSLIQIAEALHKFTLSYPVSVITFLGEQILIAKNGEINAIPLENTHFTPLSLWTGELVAVIATLNLYNPANFLAATSLATLL